MGHRLEDYGAYKGFTVNPSSILYTVSYEEYKSNLGRRLPSTTKAPQTVNPPTSEDAVSTILRDKGQLREEVCCTYHKYYEWDLDKEFFDFSQYLDVDSPQFEVDLQNFYLEMSPKCRYTLKLYRAGRSEKDYIYAWRAGVISYQGSDQGLIYEGKVNLSQELTKWTDVQQLFTVCSSYLHNSCIRPDGKVTFFIRITIIPMNFEKKVTVDRGPCNRGVFRTTSTTTGCIVETEWEMYKKVQWDIPCKSIKDCQNSSSQSVLSLNELLSPKMIYKSPVFAISNQAFYFTLEISRDSHSIRMYRLGPSVDMTIRWWLQMKNGPISAFMSDNIDLSRACTGWTYGELEFPFERVCESNFTVEFLVSKVHTICGVIQSLSAGDESPLDLDPSRTEFLSFKTALGHDFTIHRSLLAMRVPVFEAMLSHDTVESRTGVLCCADDVDPIVIAMLLHYVDTGNGPMWTEERIPLLIIKFIAGLFVVADKYLLPKLRDMCLCLLNEIGDSDDTVIWRAVADEVDKFADILSTLPPEMLQHYSVIHFFHTYEGEK